LSVRVARGGAAEASADGDKAAKAENKAAKTEKRVDSAAKKASGHRG
jgi:hypothetical protein